MIAASLKEQCNPVVKINVTFRSYKSFDVSNSTDELARVPFHVAQIFDDIDDIDDIYWAHELFLRQVFDENTPIKEKVP